MPAESVPVPPPQITPEIIDVMESLVDENECWFDHHGGCQEHGFLSLSPGEVCPNERAKQIIKSAAAFSAVPQAVVHEDTGLRCLAGHQEGSWTKPHILPPCIKCTCGTWVRPEEWNSHGKREETP